MNESPISAANPLPGPAESGWPWSAGVRVFRRLGRGGRWLLLALSLLLPLVALFPDAASWAGIDPLPSAAAALLALPGLYFLACAWIARKGRPDAPHAFEAVLRVDDATTDTAKGEGGAGASDPGGPAAQAGGAEPADPAAADRTDAAQAPSSECSHAPGREGGLELEAGPDRRNEPEPTPEPEQEPTPALLAAARADRSAEASSDLRTCHAEIRMATDEIARRTVALAGMLDACSQAMETAVADLDALQDEERVAQKVLVTLRARLLALDHRNHALMRTALAGNGVAEDPGALEKAVQAAETQVLHCHQLSERLGAAERGAVRHVDSLRRIAEVLTHHAQRGLRESQQLMVLTRKVGASLAAAEARVRTGTDRPVPPAA